MSHQDQDKTGKSCCGPSSTARPWYRNKAVIVLAVVLALLALSAIVPVLVSFRERFLMYLGMVWWAILLGLVLSGLIEHFIPQEYISRVLSHPQKRTIFYSVGLSFLASACSCGVLTLSIQLHKKGASTAAVVAFLLSSPWANLPLMLLLIGFWGLLKTLYFIGAAIIIALITGLIFQVLERYDLVERNRRTLELAEDYSIFRDIRRRFREFSWSAQAWKGVFLGVGKGIAEISDMVLWWLLIGMALAAFVGAYIPTELFQRYMGPTLGGLLTTLALGTLLEVCSEGTSPVAYEIFRKTGAFGNSFVFLMGGVVTDYTEIGLLWHNVGRRTAVWFPIVTVPQVILFGYWANKLF